MEKLWQFDGQLAMPNSLMVLPYTNISCYTPGITDMGVLSYSCIYIIKPAYIIIYDLPLLHVCDIRVRRLLNILIIQACD